MKKRKSTNQIIDDFKEHLNLRFDSEVANLLRIKSTVISVCRYRGSSAILFPIMDYCIEYEIGIKHIFYTKKNIKETQ